MNDEKTKEECSRKKWEFNGILHFSSNRALSFYTEIVNLVLDVKTTIDEKEEIYLNAVYGNKIFRKLNNPDKDVYNEYGCIQYIDMFMTKFRGILFDFKRELTWSFECNF